jgi:hypothetical protein
MCEGAQKKDMPWKASSALEESAGKLPLLKFHLLVLHAA